MRVEIIAVILGDNNMLLGMLRTTSMRLEPLCWLETSTSTACAMTRKSLLSVGSGSAQQVMSK